MEGLAEAPLQRGRRGVSRPLRPRLAVAALLAAVGCRSAAAATGDYQVDLGQHVCNGHDEDWGDCAPQVPCVDCVPVNCEFDEWGEWYMAGGCVGLKFRHRTIKHQNNECGMPCSGVAIQSEQHVLDKCVDTERDCKFSEWADWSLCASVMDQSVRTRKVDQLPTRDGLKCLGPMEETKPCGGPAKQSCAFSEWQEWTRCSASCGTGHYSRHRRIDVPASDGGAPCEGELLQDEPCRVADCPSKDCEMSDWSLWSDCDSEHWQRTRSREIVAPPLGEGRPCELIMEETAGCKRPDPEDCRVSEWGGWSSCDKSCSGGQRYRERNLLVASRNGGSCPWQPTKTTEACNTAACPSGKLNCFIAPWTLWSPCSVTVGTGTQSRVRMVSSLAQNGGEGCNGTLAEVMPCQVTGWAAIDCKWGDWEEWSGCTVTCGGGNRQRSRVIAQAAENGGKSCPALDKIEVAPCSTDQCDQGCVDAAWSNWMEWTTCSATCSQGYKSRRRTVDVEANHCGKPVEGLHEEFAVCSELPPCVVIADCALSTWGDWSQCSCDCFGVRERNRRIDTYASGNGTLCQDEALKIIESCNPGKEGVLPEQCQETPPQDCVLSEWQEWSMCSQTCGGGQMGRKRSVLRPSKRGGKPCEDSVDSTEACNTAPCEARVCQDCQWGSWTEWSSCSECGGQRDRRRSIERLPNSCGKPCELGSAKEVTNCTGCSKDFYCTWSEWSESLNCGATCGQQTAMQSRTMDLLPNAKADAFFFKGVKSSKCSGRQLKVAECPFVQQCSGNETAVNCEFSDWSDWNAPNCLGLCERQRTIKVMNNALGDPCNGALLATKTCPTSCNAPEDCVLSEWSVWSACDSGTLGQRYRARRIMQMPMNGGMACSGPLNETVACNVVDSAPCDFDDWAEWGACSQSCGDGTRQRLRDIANMATGGGQMCDGSLSEIQACHGDGCPPPVPQDCEFSPWLAWGPCSPKSQRSRSRSFKLPAQGGGMPCIGPLSETQSCIKDPVDCIVSDWTHWEECDKTCGEGQTQRQRQIERYPRTGGKLCPPDLIETKGCNVMPCDVRDCLVSGWGEWSACSKTCGPSMQSRHREVVTFRSAGGAGCFFELGQTKECGENPDCPPRDCEWGQWKEWSHCSAHCDGGIRSRNREIETVATAGGVPCHAFEKEIVEPCNLGDCAQKCTDGAWGDWEQWSSCSVTCAGGTMFRKRKIAKMANECGKEPEGKDRETKFCAVDIHCEEPRDCIFNQWNEWSACSASCTGIKQRSRSVATYGRSTGAFCIGPLKETYPCNPGEDEQTPIGCSDGPDVDCLLSDWGAWSVCSASCGGGEHMRTRSIAQHPLNNGRSCDGAMDEIRECARESCGGPQAVDCQFGDWQEWGECTRCSGERKRSRLIIHYPANGGMSCDAFDGEEIGRCPRECHGELFCTWDAWEAWSDCSTTCGTGGKRARRRSLQLSDRSPEELSSLSDVLERYEVLSRQTRDLEVQHTQEIVMAFSAGCLALVSVMVGGRAFRQRRGQADADRQRLIG